MKATGQERLWEDGWSSGDPEEEKAGSVPKVLSPPTHTNPPLFYLREQPDGPAFSLPIQCFFLLRAFVDHLLLLPHCQFPPSRKPSTFSRKPYTGNLSFCSTVSIHRHTFQNQEPSHPQATAQELETETGSKLPKADTSYLCNSGLSSRSEKAQGRLWLYFYFIYGGEPLLSGAQGLLLICALGRCVGDHMRCQGSNRVNHVQGQ